MEKIKRNRSLTEYNNCLGEEEISKVLKEECKLPEEIEVYEIEGGITFTITPDENKAVIMFAPRKKDHTVDIVRIQKSKYVTDIQIAVSQFLSQYKIKNPFGLRPRNHMPTTSFLKGIASYMSVVADSDEDIIKTLEICKETSKKQGILKSKHGKPFSYEFINGFVNVRGSARGNFF